MSTKFFNTKKSGAAKTKPIIKMGIIGTVVVAITAAAGWGGYQLIQSGASRSDQSSYPTPSSSPRTDYSQQANPPKQERGFFNSFSDSKPTATPSKSSKSKKSLAKQGKHKKGKKVAKNKRGKNKHLAKYKYGKSGKHLAKKKHGKKHLAKHAKKKHKKTAKKKNHGNQQMVSASK